MTGRPAALFCCRHRRSHVRHPQPVPHVVDAEPPRFELLQRGLRLPAILAFIGGVALIVVALRTVFEVATGDYPPAAIACATTPHRCRTVAASADGLKVSVRTHPREHRCEVWWRLLRLQRRVVILPAGWRRRDDAAHRPGRKASTAEPTVPRAENALRKVERRVIAVVAPETIIRGDGSHLLISHTRSGVSEVWPGAGERMRHSWRRTDLSPSLQPCENRR